MAATPKKNATYEDILALPSGVNGQIIHGVLHTNPRPAPKHARAATRITSAVEPKFGGGHGPDGSDGWVILFEPELHLAAHVLIPDIAGWRRERMPEMPVDKAYFTLPPDWVCEVLSPRTAPLDRGDKLKIYAEFEVKHVWFADPEAQTLEIYERDPKGYRIHDVFSGDAKIRAVPFDAIELELGLLWAR